MSVAIEREGATPAVRTCDVCGVVDALALGTCLSCGAGESTRLLFLDRTPRRADRRAVRDWLLDGLGATVELDDAGEAAAGFRPIAALSEASATRAVAALAVMGLAAASVAPDRRWRRLPTGLVGLMVAILAAGALAAATASGAFFLLSATFVGLTASAALARLARPIWTAPQTSVLGLPGPSERVVRATLDRLQKGRAWAVLADLAALAAGLLVAGDGDPDAETRAAVHELLVLACDAATDLDSLDTGIAVLDRRSEEGPIDASVADAISKAAAARALLARRLNEALASLGRLQAASSDAPQRVGELAERLAEDAAHRQVASETVRRLTSPGGR